MLALFRNLMHLVKPKPNIPHSSREQLALAMRYHQPSWLKNEERWRQRARISTIQHALDPATSKKLTQKALHNLKRWKKHTKIAPNRVEVFEKDWGVVSLESTRNFGAIYAILDPSHTDSIGGKFLTGETLSQEENMLTRSTTIQSLIDGLNQEDPLIYLDSDQLIFRYEDEATKWLTGEKTLNKDKLAVLNAKTKLNKTSAFTCYLNTNKIDVCFKGPEITHYDKSHQLYTIYREGSYRQLPMHLVFPFYELRSAAVDLSEEKGINWDDPHFVIDYESKMRHRIEAQLDACIVNNIRHLVLTAFGCGKCNGNPYLVAKLYRRAIEERANAFDHIVFAIKSVTPNENFSAFYHTLHQLPLSGNLKNTRAQMLKR